MFLCQIGEEITSTISMVWYFTTKSGGIWKIPQSVIARLLGVHRLTVRNYIRTRKLQKPAT
jgi:hypothetical protein